MYSRTKRAWLLMPGLIVALVAGGCIEREGRPVNPCTQVTVGKSIEVNNVDKVDLLFMVDNSNSMTEEQASLAEQFPNMIRILTTGDFDQNGSTDDPLDFQPVKDLNVGIITSDMGVDGISGVPTCDPNFGDDGLLQTTGHSATGRTCNASYPPVLNYHTDSGVTPDSFANDVACVAVLGTGGCGFEHQLEAPLKAVTPTAMQSWTAPGFVAIGTPGAPRGLERPFWQNSSPHGDRENAGFARDNSVLAIVLVTDEEDCSAYDSGLYDLGSTTYTGPLNLRCHQYGEQAVHPIDRYINGFLQLRTRPGLLVYAAITGIPADLSPTCMDGVCERPNWDALIGDPSVRDPRMLETVSDTGMDLVPSCNVPGRGTAYPPIRIVGVARGLEEAGAGVSVHSICQASFSNALLDVISQIKGALSAACLPRPLNQQSDGSVNCDVVSVMPMGMDCAAIGAEAKVDDNMNPILEDGRSVCVIHQLVPSADDRTAGREPAGDGVTASWYYDNYTMDGADNCGPTFQRIAFVDPQPPTGAQVRLECFLAVQGSGDTIGIGTFCDPDAADATDENRCSQAQAPVGNTALSCDPVSRVCGVPCSAQEGGDSQCRAAGLIGYVCDTRPLSETGSNFADRTNCTNGVGPDCHGFCVNPTCG